MKKLNKQALLDLEKETKHIRLLDKTDAIEFTKALTEYKEHLEQLSSALDKELEKYSYCENCHSYHNDHDAQKHIVEIKEEEPNYGYIYDVCPVCGAKKFLEKRLLEKK